MLLEFLQLFLPYRTFNPYDIVGNGLGVGVFCLIFLAQRRQAAKKDKRIGNRIDELFELAIEDFERNLEKLRKFYPVKTICMHGSPLSKWDNRDLWKKYDYRDSGIIAEPYIDLDCEEVFYLTDTGRRWDGESVSVRDKVGGQRTDDRGRKSKKVRKSEDQKIRNKTGLTQRRKGAEKRQRRFEDLRFRSTFDIIAAAEKGLLPDKIMINTHPQRWTDNPVAWMKELVWQNVKNVIKKGMVSRKDAKPQRIDKKMLG